MGGIKNNDLRCLLHACTSPSVGPTHDSSSSNPTPNPILIQIPTPDYPALALVPATALTGREPLSFKWRRSNVWEMGITRCAQTINTSSIA